MQTQDTLGYFGRCFHTGLDERLLVVIWKQHIVKDLRQTVLTSERWTLSRHLLQMLHSKFICSAINRLTALIGTRVCMFQSLEHFGHTLTLASRVMSHAHPFLPKLSGVPLFFLFCFFFLAVLLLLRSPLACSFCLSAGDVCSACQWAFTPVPCLLLSAPLCSFAALLIPSVNEHSRVSVSIFFFF